MQTSGRDKMSKIITLDKKALELCAHKLEGTKLLPWETKLHFLYDELQIVPAANQDRVYKRSNSNKRFIAKSEKARNFKQAIAFATRQMTAIATKRPGDAEGITFPLPGAKCPLRLEIYFGFSLSGNGRQRLKLTDLDNCLKGFIDGLSGTLIDSDRYIYEIVTAKGDAPTDKWDIIRLAVTRSGCRTWKQLEDLAANVRAWPPWTFEIQTGIARPGSPGAPGNAPRIIMG